MSITRICKGKTAGEIRPLVNPNKCEGKGDCVVACPFDVFTVTEMSDEVFGSLSFLGKIKALSHGKKTATTPLAERCMNCGSCVVACPEQAIKLRRFRAAAP